VFVNVNLRLAAILKKGLILGDTPPPVEQNEMQFFWKENVQEVGNGWLWWSILVAEVHYYIDQMSRKSHVQHCDP